MPCTDSADNFSDFVFEVQMKIIQGDIGGIVFRGNFTTGNSYYVKINQNGEYFLDQQIGTTNVLASGHPPYIHAGLNQAHPHISEVGSRRVASTIGSEWCFSKVVTL